MAVFTTSDGSSSLHSARYGEAFRSRHGAHSESWHVFVAGSGVAARLAGGQPTSVLEIGLGTARNFATSAGVALAFGTPLHYVALEREVQSAEAWASQDRDALGPPALRAALLSARARWDVGDGGGGDLTLGPVRFEVYVGDAAALSWPTLLDAVYLDGFSPAVNPELWSDSLLQRVAKSLRPGGTAVSYCVQGDVRRSLAAAGLRVERRAGPPGGKREVLWAQSPAGAHGTPSAGTGLASMRLAVVGAGVAGGSLALAAAEAGAEVASVDAADGTTGASGAPAALINPHRGRSGRADPDDQLGALTTWRWAAALHEAGYDSGAHPTAVVRVADRSRQALAWRDLEGVLAFGPETEPSALRWRAPHGGMLVPSGGWIDPWRWLRALRSAAGARGASWHPLAAVERLERAPDGGLRLVGPHLDGLGTFDAVALCLGASSPGALPHLPVTPLPGAMALMPGHAPARPLAGAVSAAPVGTPERFGLDPRAAYFAASGSTVGGGDEGERLRSGVAGALPRTPAAPQALWRGLRARGSDLWPQVALLEPGVWWFGAFAGRGFLRAALEAERLVSLLARGRSDRRSP